MDEADFLIIGGGMAGLSAASRLVGHGRTIVLEAEDALGYHSSGRSVSYSHFGIGNETVRALTAWSQTFFRDQPQGFCDTPLAVRSPSLQFADEESLDRLDAMEAAISEHGDPIVRLGPEEIRRHCPIVRTGPGAAVAGLLDPEALKLDADAMLQSYARAVRAGGGRILTGRRISALAHEGGFWIAEAESGERFAAPILVDAAGAWADRVAAMAGVRPLGLQPKRRTIIAVDPPEGMAVAAWPFVHSVRADFYMLPESGRLLASPADEVEDEPCDAAPDDYDMAYAADRLEHYCEIEVKRIVHRWAGLRSFVADRVPTAGFAPDAPGFFWLAGQGGYGLQTAPAMAAIAEALVTGGAWPAGLDELGITRDKIEPARLFGR
ncbi:MAG TPA: FAD-binding oxidoreductase [Allosphingosinicella sp.]